MGTPVIQTNFASGEWAPSLNARVDLGKYHSAAATVRNFYVDYRGGVSTRPGTKYLLQAYKSATAVRLIPFQASFTVSYVLEFGDQYIRFFSNGASILETAIVLTAATSANPGVFTKAAHGLSVGDWVFSTVFTGGTWSTFNSKYYIVSTVPTVNTFTLTDLRGNVIDTSSLGAWATGSVARVYTLPSPYTANELSTLKFAQNVNTLILCQTNHSPYVLTLTSANNWTLVPIVFGSNVTMPTGMGIATTLAGSANYSYVVTAVDIKGQESVTSAVVASTIGAGFVTLTVSWAAVSGAQSYNIYRAGPSVAGAMPAGSSFGFVSNVTGVSFADTFNSGIGVISTDYSQRIPIARNPFQGAGVASATITASGSPLVTPVPTVTFAAAPVGGVTATGGAIAGVQGTPTNGGVSGGLVVGDILDYAAAGVSVVVATIGGGGQLATCQPITFPGSNPGALLSGAAIPANPVTFICRRNPALVPPVNLAWGINSINIINQGAGYVAAPAITFSAGAAAATAVLGTAAAGSPTVTRYYNQRLWFGGPAGSPSEFDASQPGAPYNFNVTDPVQADNAIQGTLVSDKLNTIKAMVGMPTGLVILSDQQAWLLNGGSSSAVPTAIDLKANQHAYNGACDVPPIVANFDILYVQAKGSIVRDLTYNFYTNIFTGTDISVLSSHLFYGYTLTEWAWAEEPFKVVWAVRNDGTMLTLTFLKEQELIGWTRNDTNGLFKSVCSVTEQVSFGSVDAVYTVVQRTIQSQTVKYIERVAERIFTNGATDAWCVDAGLQYSGAPATSFTGGDHLAGATVTGLADGVVIPAFVMPASGSFTLATAASKVTVGLAFTAQLKTLALDVGEPTVQGEPKKIQGVTVRVADTLGLTIGSDANNQVSMKDFVVGNVSTTLTGLQSSQVISGLVTGDGYSAIDPTWNIPGQYLIQQAQPLPASILGVIPQISTGGKK